MEKAPRLDNNNIFPNNFRRRKRGKGEREKKVPVGLVPE